MRKYISGALALLAILLILISILDFTKHEEPTKVFTVNMSQHVISGTEYSGLIEISLGFDEKDSKYTYISNSVSATIYNNNYSMAFDITDISYVRRAKDGKQNYYVYNYTLRPLVSGTEFIMSDAKLKLVYKDSSEIDIKIGELSVVKDNNLVSNDVEIVSKMGTVSNDGSETQMNGVVIGFRNKTSENIEITSINIKSNEVYILNQYATKYKDTDDNVINIEDLGLNKSDIESSNTLGTTSIILEPSEVVYYFFPISYKSDILITSFPLYVSYKVVGSKAVYLDYEWKYLDLTFTNASDIRNYLNWEQL